MDVVQPTIGVSTTTYQISLLITLASNSGLLQSFPAHADPVYENAIGVRLRQTLHLKFIEFDAEFVGSQSNTIVASDLYNNMRISIFRTGETYQSANLNYATSILSTDIRDVQKVYYDEVIPLPSVAFDTANNTNVPNVKIRSMRIPINLKLSFFSSNASGAGAAWETRESDLVINVVSDSAVAPNPTIQFNSRLWFEYVRSQR